MSVQKQEPERVRLAQSKHSPQFSGKIIIQGLSNFVMDYGQDIRIQMCKVNRSILEHFQL